MADSFFEFNTSLTGLELDDGPDLDEEEYDALNHETFGDNAFQGDWEEDHTRFAEVTESSRIYPSCFNSDSDEDLDEDDEDLDLEASLSQLVLEEGEDEEVVPVTQAATKVSKSINIPDNCKSENKQRYSSTIWSTDSKKNVSSSKQVQQTADPSAPVHSAIHFLPPQIPRIPTVQELETDLIQKNKQSKAVGKEVKANNNNNNNNNNNAMNILNQGRSAVQNVNQQALPPLNSNAMQQQNLRSKFTYCVGNNNYPPGFGNMQMPPFVQPPQQEMVLIRNNVNVPMMLGPRLMPPYILPNPPLLLPQNPRLVPPHMMTFIPPHQVLVPQQQQQQQQSQQQPQQQPQQQQQQPPPPPPPPPPQQPQQNPPQLPPPPHPPQQHPPPPHPPQQLPPPPHPPQQQPHLPPPHQHLPKPQQAHLPLPQQPLPKPQPAHLPLPQQQLPKPQQPHLPLPQQHHPNQQQPHLPPHPQQHHPNQQQPHLPPHPQQHHPNQQQPHLPSHPHHQHQLHHQQQHVQHPYQVQQQHHPHQYPPQQQHLQHQQQFHQHPPPPQQFQLLVQQYHVMLQNNMQERNNMVHMEGQNISYCPKHVKNMSNGHSSKNHLPDRRGAGDYDEYAGLMNKGERIWIRNIQLIQLTADKPHMDDYYYNEWLKKQENKVKKDSQTTNGIKKNKTVTTNNKQCQTDGGIRDRKDADRDSGFAPSPRAYVPLQFENSLGKLQCVSITAPRKIIDLDVVSEPQAEAAPVTNQRDSRKTKKLLLELERLYLMALEIDEIDANIRMEEKQFTKPQLIDKIITSFLNENRFVSFMCIRKGKALLLRILKHVKGSDHIDQLSDLWCRTVKSIATVVRRDQNDGILLQLYPYFKKWIDMASYDKLSVLTSFLLTGNTMPSVKSSSRAVSPVSGKTVLSVSLASKFGVSVISSILARGEAVYPNLVEKEQLDWAAFIFSFTKQMTNVPNLENIPSPLEPLNSEIVTSILNRSTGLHIQDYASIKRILSCFQ